MSWYGSHAHARISKERVRKVLPPGACKVCVYFARLLPQMREHRHNKKPTKKSACCGISYVPADIIRQLEQQLDEN